MTEASAKIILDSINEYGQRLTTQEVTFPRFVLAEFNTHRAFSRNSASSRAIPVEKQMAKILESPVQPFKWPCEQPGMQGGSDLEGWDLDAAMEFWDLATEFAASAVQAYLGYVEEQYPREEEETDKGYKDRIKSHTLHKSLINRVLEPFMWHTVIVTATDWDGFWDQRCSPLAQPEIEAPAQLMREAYENSTPTLLKFGEWHTPYIQPDEYKMMDVDMRVKISAARCARVSYLTQDGKRDLEADLKLFNRLTQESPPHASPLEHVATPTADQLETVGNFRGWHQLRHRYWT